MADRQRAAWAGISPHVRATLSLEGSAGWYGQPGVQFRASGLSPLAPGRPAGQFAEHDEGMRCLI